MKPQVKRRAHNWYALNQTEVNDMSAKIKIKKEVELTTALAAKKMLATGCFFSTDDIVKKFKCSKVRAAQCLLSIRRGDRYETEVKRDPIRVKVLSIGEKKEASPLDNRFLLFPVPKLLQSKRA